MKRFARACILLLLLLSFAACGEKRDDLLQDGSESALCDREPNANLLETNQKIEQRWSFYRNQCEKIPLDPYASDVFDNTEKKLSHVYRTVQYVMFDTVTDNRFSSGGVYNYDLYLYEDGTAELLYRHYNEGDPYALWRELRIVLCEEELASVRAVLAEWPHTEIPTWDPKAPTGMDGEGTYIFGSDGWNEHLAYAWCSTPGNGVYHIRTAMEQIVRAHEPEGIFDAFLCGEERVRDGDEMRDIASFFAEKKGTLGNGYAYIDSDSDGQIELHLRTLFAYDVISYDPEYGLYVSYSLMLEAWGQDTLAYRYYVLEGEHPTFYFKWYDEDGDRGRSDADRYVWGQEEVTV